MAAFKGIFILVWSSLLILILMVPFFTISFIIHIWDKSGRFAHSYIRFWSTLSFVWVKSTITGKEKMLRKTPVLYVSNHQSFLDIFLINVHISGQYKWVSKKSLLNIPVFGWCMRTAKYIPLVRGDREDAQRMLDKSVYWLKNGISVVIFPEGTWGYPDGTMRRFKRGTAIILKRTNVPIQPITVIGSNKANPSDSFKFYNHPIKIIVDNPILPEEYKDKSEQEILDMIRQVFQHNLDNNK